MDPKVKSGRVKEKVELQKKRNKENNQSLGREQKKRRKNHAWKIFEETNSTC